MNISDNLSDLIKTYRNNNKYEIIFTLGKYTDEFGFEDHLFSKENFNKIYKSLDTCTSWDSVVDETDEIYSDVPEKVIDSIIFKSDSSPYDILVSVCSKNTERLFKNNDYIEHVTMYSRKHHIYKPISIDTTFSQNFFKFVLKLVPDNKTSDKYLADSSILKILDILNMCENVGKDIKFTKI